jgi:hypothetical protein
LEDIQNPELDFSQQQEPSPFSKSQLPLNLFKDRQLKSASTSDKEKLELRAKTTIPSNYSSFPDTTETTQM